MNIPLNFKTDIGYPVLLRSVFFLTKLGWNVVMGKATADVANYLIIMNMEPVEIACPT